VVAGVIGRRRCDARDISTPVPRYRIGVASGLLARGRLVSAWRDRGLTTGLVTESEWISRVSRIAICLPFVPASFALVFECYRSSVRFIEHVIELLPNDRTAHRQISAMPSGDRR
jgi:hypothetical protein